MTPSTPTKRKRAPLTHRHPLTGARCSESVYYAETAAIRLAGRLASGEVQPRPVLPLGAAPSGRGRLRLRVAAGGVLRVAHRATHEQAKQWRARVLLRDAEAQACTEGREVCWLAATNTHPRDAAGAPPM